jgi:hypothetical protein
MEPTEITIEILKDIRDEIRGLRQGQDALSDEVRSLKAAQVSTEVHLATALADVVGALEGVKTLLRENYASTIRDLDRRVTALEARVEP